MVKNKAPKRKTAKKKVAKKTVRKKASSNNNIRKCQKLPNPNLPIGDVYKVNDPRINKKVTWKHVWVGETMEYDIFNAMPKNREVKEPVATFKNLTESMGVLGFFIGKPVVCVWRKGKLIVIDGHHRVQAAIKAKQPVNFVVGNLPDEAVVWFNTSSKTWAMKDYLMWFSGDPNYDKLAAIGKNEPEMKVAAKIQIARIGNGYTQTDTERMFKRGFFVYGNHRKIREFYKTLLSFRANCPEYWCNARFIKALKKVLNSGGVDASRMRAQAVVHAKRYLNFGSDRVTDFESALLKLYNYGFNKDDKFVARASVKVSA